jgi:hypothetical protein
MHADRKSILYEESGLTQQENIDNIGASRIYDEDDPLDRLRKAFSIPEVGYVSHTEPPEKKNPGKTLA